MFDICLKTLARANTQNTTQLTLSDRLPNYIEGPCTVVCTYQVQQEMDYYILKLRIQGSLKIICQRCLGAFDVSYDKETLFAICRNEERASALMDRYESFVGGPEVDLIQLVTDELYISVEDKHEKIEDCDNEVISLMR